MSIFTSRYALGIHASETGVHAVLLSRGGRGSAPQVVKSASFRCHEDGLLSLAEVRTAFHNWVSQHCPVQADVASVLSQDDVSYSFAVLPPARSRQKLLQLVRYQSASLDGLTDSSFLRDFQQFSIDGEIRTMIIQAREEQVEGHVDLLRECGLVPQIVTCECLALGNAYAGLFPEDFSRCSHSPDEVHVVVYAGREQRLAAVFWKGVPQVMGDLDSATALKMPIEAELDVMLRRLTVPEGQTAPRVAKLFLCGDRPDLEPVRARLEDYFSAPSVLFSLRQPCPDSGTVEAHPELVIAYGAALQVFGNSELKMTLALPVLEAINMRRQERRFLIYGVLAVVACIISFISVFSLYMEHCRNELKKRENALSQCQDLEVLLEDAYGRIMQRQRRLLPLRNALSRSRLFLKTLDYLKESRPDDSGWQIYLADDGIFVADNAVEELARPVTKGRSKAAAASSAAAIQEPSVVSAPEIKANGAETAENDKEDARLKVVVVYPACQMVSQLQPVRAFYIGGFVVSGDAKYQTVKELQERLMATRAFGKVDDCLEDASENFRERFFRPWKKFLDDNAEGLKRQYTPFLLELPFPVKNGEQEKATGSSPDGMEFISVEEKEPSSSADDADTPEADVSGASEETPPSTGRESR